MNILLFPVNFCIYGTIAFVISAFYGYQGILIQWHVTHNDNIKLKNDNIKLKSENIMFNEYKEWALWERCFIHYLEYFIFNFVCGLAGFVALFVECKIFQNIKDYANISGGTAALLVFLSLVSVIGIAGKLSFVIVHGKIFGSKA